jgi:hypothetical protein
MAMGGIPHCLENVNPKQSAVQNIDLLIDRADNIIELCEFKFHQSPIALTKADEDKLRLHTGAFRHYTGTKSIIHWTFITASGLVQNAYSADIVTHDFTMDVLFEEA